MFKWLRVNEAIKEDQLKIRRKKTTPLFDNKMKMLSKMWHTHTRTHTLNKSNNTDNRINGKQIATIQSKTGKKHNECFGLFELFP